MFLESHDIVLLFYIWRSFAVTQSKAECSPGVLLQILLFKSGQHTGLDGRHTFVLLGTQTHGGL
jgi:hypothetical protein